MYINLSSSKRIINGIILFLFSTFQLSDLLQAQESAFKHPEWSRNATIYEVNLRQYTPEGTFKAFEKHLPRLKELGVDILWLMPIHPIGEKNRKGSLGSYYSVKDYFDVNPEHGSLDDFKELVKNIHNMDMYILIDWVANHSACDNLLTVTNQDFYTVNIDGEFIPPVADWSDVIDFNYDNKELWNYMIDALKFWVSECDIDGYRCDVAAMVPTDFWIEVRKELDEIKPVFMLAEAHEPELHQAFDMTYNWQLKDIMNSIAAGKNNVKGLDEWLMNEREDYKSNDYRMNFSTNHDENSWNGTVYERLGDGAEPFAVLTALVEGMPLIYSGQEAGLDKRLSFFEKDQINWREHKLRAVYTQLFELKKNNRALGNGDHGGRLHRVQTDNDENVFAFVRKKYDDKIFVIMNLSNENLDITINEKKIVGNYKELFTCEKVVLKETEKFNLEPWKYLIYVK